jgi:uncharacterized membrane protein YphA (DoxX/SURF4 family)
MRMSITPGEIAPRLTTGVFFLHSGLSKRHADEATAAGLHGFASGTYPFLKNVPPTTFAKVLSTSEIVLGAALLTPFVPTVVAGAALTAFSASLIGLYLRTPGMRKPGSLAPTQEGLPIAKDVWLIGIGLGLLANGLLDRSDSAPTAPLSRSDRKAAARAGSTSAKQARLSARQAGTTAGRAAARVREIVTI